MPRQTNDWVAKTKLQCSIKRRLENIHLHLHSFQLPPKIKNPFPQVPNFCLQLLHLPQLLQFLLLLLTWHGAFAFPTFLHLCNLLVKTLQSLVSSEFFNCGHNNFICVGTRPCHWDGHEPRSGQLDRPWGYRRG